jgi:hypothetical protein
MLKIIQRVLTSVLLVLALALTASAADITGKWTGSGELTRADGTTRDTSVYLDLRQEGQEVTGSAGPDPDQVLPISKGKLDGGKLTFEVVARSDSGDVTYTFEFAISGDKMEGTVKSPRFTGKLTLKRS